MHQNKLPHDSRHLGVPSGVPKMISMPEVHSAQTVHLSCAKTNTTSKWTKTSFHMSHDTLESWSTIGCAENDFHARGTFDAKPCNYVALRLTLPPNGPKRASLGQHYLGVRSGVPKIISMPKVHSAQTVHQSYAKTNTILKWTKTSFHSTYIT